MRGRGSGRGGGGGLSHTVYTAGVPSSVIAVSGSEALSKP